MNIFDSSQLKKVFSRKKLVTSLDKICSALTENMNRDLHSVHWEKVTKVPFMFMTEFPLKKWPKFRSWTWTERELNGKSSVPTMLWDIPSYVIWPAPYYSFGDISLVSHISSVELGTQNVGFGLWNCSLEKKNLKAKYYLVTRH